MDDYFLNDDTTFEFRHNLERRVQNLALGPRTPSNALVPVFEAVYNAIHAVEDRFGPSWAKRSDIRVTIINYGSDSPSIEITDNGCGIDASNFDSFRTYDSDLKLRRGGKGVGRLTWLKVFESAFVSSVYYHGDTKYRRSFHLRLDNDAPIQEHFVQRDPSEDLGTTVLLNKMKTAYSRNMPSKIDTILNKLIGHFLPYFISDDKPSISVITDDDSFDLGSFLANNQRSLGHADLEFDNGNPARLQHTFLDRGVVENPAQHTLYFSANGRVVREHHISTALGLNTAIEEDGHRFAYAGVVSGQYLDDVVNAERTAFDINQDAFDELLKVSISSVRDVLRDPIERVVARQATLTKSVITKYPRFSYLVGDAEKFAREDLPRNLKSAEDIYKQLSVLDFRENRSLERRVEAASKNENDDSDAVESNVGDILARLTDQELSSLADYTVRRKVLLDLMEKRLGYRPDGEMKHHAEEALHKFIVPMRVTNHDVHIDSHNLWIVDDKLAYYEHWASDRQMKKTIQESDSLDRPDLVLFGGRTAFHRPGTDQPVVIVEFKKPARNDYSDEENPFSQVFSYIEEMRLGRARDRDGGIIQEITDNTPFFCYIIADLTPRLKSWANQFQINVPLPGGSGFYGYNPTYKSFVQVLSYKFVVKDARLRNEAFFKRLSI